MTPENLKNLLLGVQNRTMNIDTALEQLRQFPCEDLGHSNIDHHRQLRQGMPEVIFGEGKTVEQIQSIMVAMQGRGTNILVTRCTADKAHELQRFFPQGEFHGEARCLTLQQTPPVITGKGSILIISAGTSDIPVAAEALVTARFLGNQVDQMYDVGVAGIHRLLSRRETLDAASVIIVVAGMEGALPSVVGGLVDKPVIAVPTSVGYGASFGGIAALLGMLNSCASGVTVVNIDNGFGAACAANLINRI